MTPEQSATIPLKAWLVLMSGPLPGTRYPLPEGATRVGRAPDNDIVVDGPDCGTVSLYHLEIHRDGEACRIRDLDSTNGTFLNGERVGEGELTFPAQVRLGSTGPEYTLVMDEVKPAELDRTTEISPSSLTSTAAATTSAAAAHDELLSSAVIRARRMRAHGVGGQTMSIMREVIEQALRSSHRRLRTIGYLLLVSLVAVSSFSIWRIVTWKREKRQIDAQIKQLEQELEKSSDSTNTDQLLSRLDLYQSQALSMRGSLLFRLGGVAEDTDLVTRELRAVMAELGAEVYSIPPEFVDRVNFYVARNQGPDRPLVERALSESRHRLQRIRQILQEEQLPADLAYIPIVESAVDAGNASAAGAAGYWQFTAPTARAYGLRVDGQVDERTDLVKSTRASCKYLRDLILDFGAGSSVLLALAAYNSGPGKVKQAVAKTVRDPIKQRNFWYLYRVKALPLETREYVPKVFAAILIGRNPRHFGF